MPRGQMTGAFVYLVLVSDLTGSQSEPWSAYWVWSRWRRAWSRWRWRWKWSGRCPARMNITSLSLYAITMVTSKLLTIPNPRDHQSLKFVKSCTIEIRDEILEMPTEIKRVFFTLV